jgi:hypothetical protein
MDVVTAVGLTASLVQLIDLVSKTISFLGRIKNAPKERANLAVELAGLLPLLTSLRYRVEEFVGKEEKGSSWFAAVRFLGVKNGPIDQLQNTMKVMSTTVSTRHSFKESVVWPFKKKDMETHLHKIERLKSLIVLAFQDDLS